MAKLDELKALLEARRAATASQPAPVAPNAHREPHDVPVRRNGSGAPARPSSSARNARRLLAAGKHADGDVDIAQAFADVKRLPPRNQARVPRPTPAPIPRQRIADEYDALLASKYGAEPHPQSWDIGQEHEGEQTFVRRGLGSDVLTKLRRGHWSLQAELDLHGMTSE
jgi:hypothetical protein